MRNYSLATEKNPEDYESPLMALSFYSGRGDSEEAREFARVGVERVERHMEDYPDNPRAYYLGATGLALLGDRERAPKPASSERCPSPRPPR